MGAESRGLLETFPPAKPQTKKSPIKKFHQNRTLIHTKSQSNKKIYELSKIAFQP
jgi:hypothetical protein